jgi:hypothetical protein
MLLAVANSETLFTYVNAGAPGNLGDAGLCSASRLSKYVNDGPLRAGTVQLVVEDEPHSTFPYIVGFP